MAYLNFKLTILPIIHNDVFFAFTQSHLIYLRELL